MPRCCKDRLLTLTAAASLIAAAGTGACAQSQSFDLRGEDGQPVQTRSADAGNPDNTTASGDLDASPDIANRSGSATGTSNGADAPPPDVSNHGTVAADTPPSPDAPVSPTNYGKPKPKKPKLYQLYRLKKYGTPALPPLTTYKTAPGAAKYATPQTPNAADQQTGGQAGDPPPTVAAIPALPLAPKPKRRDDDPYAPLGITVSSLRLYPYVEADTGYDSNPNRQSQGVTG